MRIDQLTLKYFKGFESREFPFHPQFNLLVGKNGTGKTSTLDALAVAVGSWFLGIKGVAIRHIRANEVMLRDLSDAAGQGPSSVQWEYAYPCEVAAQGEVQGKPIGWRRALNGPKGRTTSREAMKIKALAAVADADVRQGKGVSLPLLAYYGTADGCGRNRGSRFRSRTRGGYPTKETSPACRVIGTASTRGSP